LGEIPPRGRLSPQIGVGPGDPSGFGATQRDECGDDGGLWESAPSTGGHEAVYLAEHAAYQPLHLVEIDTALPGSRNLQVIGDGPQAQAVHFDDEHIVFGADSGRERAVNILKRSL